MQDDFDEKMARVFQATGARSEADLARMLGISQPSVAAAKKRRKVPGAWIEKIAKSYSIDVNWLLLGRNSMRRQGTSMNDDNSKPGIQPSQSADSKGQGAMSAPQLLDRNVVLRMIAVVDGMLRELEIELPPEAKAQAIVVLCEEIQDQDQGLAALDPARILQMIRQLTTDKNFSKWRLAASSFGNCES